MAVADNILGLANIDEAEFEPMIIEGEQHGEVHFVRNEDLGRGPYRAAIWRLTEEHLPYESRYDFRFDETICILEGEMDVTFDDGANLVLREGDVVSVAAGTGSQWKITKPFKKLVVET